MKTSTPILRARRVMLRFLVPTSAVVLVVLLGLFMDAQSRTEPSPDKSSLSTEHLQHVYAMGRIEGATREVEVRPSHAGNVTDVLVHEGQVVQRGEVLAKLDDRAQRAQFDSASAAHDLAKAQFERLKNGARAEEREEAVAMFHAKLAELENAESDLKRTLSLSSNGTVSQRETDNLRGRVATLSAEARAFKARADLVTQPTREDELKIAEARIHQAHAAMTLAIVQLDKTRIRAPFDGAVLKVNIQPGEYAGIETPQPAFIVADTSRYRVRAYVEELDALRVRVGAFAAVTADGLADQTFRGNVSRLGQRMTRKQLRSDDPRERHDTKYREVWIDLDAPSEAHLSKGDGAHLLLIGLRVDVTIQLGS
jgi:ABC exporter DevB family membrane fusion protein